MTACDNCGRDDAVGYYYPDGDPLCQMCYGGASSTVTPDRAERYPDSINAAEQRSRQRVINNTGEWKR